MLAGSGAGVAGAAAHASMMLIAPVARSAGMKGADLVFSFIANLQEKPERCHRPVSRVLYPHLSMKVTVISLDAQSPTRSSSLPAASLSGWTPFAAYLALLPLGFAEPHVLPRVR